VRYPPIWSHDCQSNENGHIYAVMWKNVSHMRHIVSGAGMLVAHHMKTCKYNLEILTHDIGAYLVIDCVCPITISNGFNNVHFISTITNNPRNTAYVTWVTHISKELLLLVRVGNCKVGRSEGINYRI